LLASALFTLASCKLIDQTTFAPSSSAKPSLLPKPSSPPGLPIDKRTALLVINPGTPPRQYEPFLRYAVSQARAHDPNVQFDVVAAIPNPAAFDQGTADAAVVMRAIIAAGIPSTRVHLRAGVDPALSQRQTRLYVR
jgi:hypothetical protein